MSFYSSKSLYYMALGNDCTSIMKVNSEIEQQHQLKSGKPKEQGYEHLPDHDKMEN